MNLQIHEQGLKMLEVQEYLRSGKTLLDLKAEYAISAKEHSKMPGIFSLKYSQIDSPMGESIVQECRGLIFDANNDWAIVAHPFNKFFNHGEGHAAVIDWSTARVQEKVDGSLMIMYHHNGSWHVGTSGTSDASGDVQGFGFTFEKLFWDTWHRVIGSSLPEETDYTFMWELTSPYNKVVVPHKECGLTLIGVRDRSTDQELSVTEFEDRYPVVQSFGLQTFDELVKTFQIMDPLHQEGYVVVDKNFAHVKVKHPGYVAIHHLKDGMCLRRLVEIVRTNELEEFLTHLPEYREQYDIVKIDFDKLVEGLEMFYNSIKHIETQKNFALQAMKSKCSGILFSMRKAEQSGEPTTVRQLLANMNIQALMRVLKYKECD